MDGMNEKGLTVSVLYLDGEPTIQSSGKKNIINCLILKYKNLGAVAQLI
ncbi:MAG: hypothetical protein PUE01_13080 [Clostridiaceae bacterium]|nr:hypothetical protein [Clostridiaceae bacterium]